MPTAVNKTASYVGGVRLQNLRDFAVSNAVVEKLFCFFQIKGNGSSWFAPVHVLLPASSPAAVFRRIASFVVDAVERTALRAVSHVSDKIYEFSPAATNRNSSSAVVVKSVVTRITAPVYHVKPTIVGTASLSVSCLSVFSAIVQFGQSDLLSRLRPSGGRACQGPVVAIILA